MKHKKTSSKGTWYLFILLMLLCLPAQANNLVVENGTMANQDTGADTYDIQFDISWDNSWYSAGAPSLSSNWDAAWVFAKYSVYNSGTNTWGDWQHCKLSATDGDHTAPAGSQIDTGTTGGVGIGVFIYRSAAGTGSNNWDDAAVEWDYGADGVADNADVRVSAFGTEIVYIPTGNFYLGDTDCDNDGNIMLNAGCGGSGVQISTTITAALCTEANSYDQNIECAAGDSVGTFCIDGDGGFDLDCDGIENASFPTGYNAFYIMKYEVTQQQYVDFLNMLTRTQQNTRTASQAADQYVMSNTVNVNYRNGIRAPSSIPSGVITFGCDLDGITTHNDSTGDGTFNESNDGQWVAANYLSWMDGAAYADWAGLRPFTELEVTKARRGGQTVVDDECAWGSVSLDGDCPTSTLTNSGESGEIADDNCNLNYSNNTIDGPYRTGAYADATSTRANSGGSYYGVMELSGNLWERPVTIGQIEGRNVFTGIHGDGVLTTTASYEGNATNTDWPGINGTASRGITGATGSGFRGGAWDNGASNARVSSRYYGASTSTGRTYNYGARCARTSP